MALFTHLLGSQDREDREILAALNSLDKRRSPVLLEIENSAIRFNTRISVMSATVVVAKPPNLRNGLNRGGTVRLKLPEGEGREVRMEVITPHFNLTNGNPVFLCRIPTAYAHANQRAAVRFNTSRFRNVTLALQGHTERYRIVDICSGGCKIHLTGKEDRERFVMGASLKGARIDLGDKVSVHLDAIVARNLHAQAVGCQFTVSEEGPSRAYLAHLLRALERAELERYRTVPA